MQGGFSYDVSPAKKGADPSVRPGDLTPRKLHYQTGHATAVNGCESCKCATIYRDRLARRARSEPAAKASQLMIAASARRAAMLSNRTIDGVVAATPCGQPTFSNARHEPLGV
jgi:hypothetical protein